MEHFGVNELWVLLSAFLVFLMTLPGIVLFYGGLVRAKNVLSVATNCFFISCFVILFWWSCGYSLCFSEGNGVIGGFDLVFVDSLLGLPTVKGACHSGVFFLFQMFFAIITPCLIIGAVVERIKFKALIAFVILWMFLVYAPIAHLVWSDTGALSGMLNPKAVVPVLDFAGGLVVHVVSGCSALILCLFIGARRGYGVRSMAPHNMILCSVGSAFLWLGWLGFNGGSALQWNAAALNAVMNTLIAGAMAGMVWLMLEAALRGRASLLGICSGVVSGLVTITPACGFVSMKSALIIGALGGISSFIVIIYGKKIFKFDDSLDVFGIHGVCGAVGTLLVGFFASAEMNPDIVQLLPNLMFNQCIGLFCVVGWSTGMTVFIAILIHLIIGLRVSEEEELVGLDLSQHGEMGYEFTEED
jgi:Amt family ammonium transporter